MISEPYLFIGLHFDRDITDLGGGNETYHRTWLRAYVFNPVRQGTLIEQMRQELKQVAKEYNAREDRSNPYGIVGEMGRSVVTYVRRQGVQEFINQLPPGCGWMKVTDMRQGNLLTTRYRRALKLLEG